LLYGYDRIKDMLTKYINPNGELKEADLSMEQIEKLKKTEGFVVLEEKRLRIHISDSACIACEG
jgi:hypothetical protein